MKEKPIKRIEITPTDLLILLREDYVAIVNDAERIEIRVKA